MPSSGFVTCGQLRRDHGSVYMSDDFQNEIRFLGVESSPAFVRQPERNSCIERFFKEQLLWVRRFHDLGEGQSTLSARTFKQNRGHRVIESSKWSTLRRSA